MISVNKKLYELGLPSRMREGAAWYAAINRSMAEGIRQDTITADKTTEIVLKEATVSRIVNAFGDMIVSLLVNVYYELISYDCAR